MRPSAAKLIMPSTTGSRSQALESLLGRIQAHTAKIGIIGLGYVGLPLALLFNEASFPVTGFDIDP
jgi:UDP-N-acetyl-D-glucosamine dehydrogenase